MTDESEPGSREAYVDLAFPATGTSVPLDHGYALFGALSRVLPQLHAERMWGVHPILGRRSGPGVLELTPSSHIKLRIPTSAIANALVLTGVTLEVAGQPVQLGPPRVFPLVPSVSLRARFVTVRGFEEPEPFLDAVRRQVASAGLEQDPERIELAVGQRRVARVRDKVIVGFAVALGNLDAQASLALQRVGLGGRRHMGAGLLVPPPRRVPHG